MTLDLVGAAEVAEMLGVSRQYVSTLVKSRVGFPDPAAELSAGRIWRRGTVQEWMAANPAHIPGGKLFCSFCGKNQDAVQKLIAGPNQYDERDKKLGAVKICNECVDLCVRIIADEEADA